MNTTLHTVYPDVDSAAIKWKPDVTEGPTNWWDQQLLHLCSDLLKTLCSNESDTYKVGYAKSIATYIKEAIKAKATP